MITTDSEFWAQTVGYLSIACWFVVFTPQLYENYSRKNTDGVSVRFLWLWIFGDVTNLLGIVLEDLLVTMLLVAVYYLFSDVLLMGQVYYYRSRYPQSAKEDVLEPTAPNASAWNEQEPETDDEETPLVGKKKHVTSETRRIVSIFKVSSVIFVVCVLAGSAYYFFGGDEKADITHLHLTAQLFGWASALLYCASRIPQIMQNFRKESVEGLSIFMFVFSVLGNLLYCISIFLKSTDRTYLLVNYPWLLGSGGTLFFDFVIFFQFYIYRIRSNSSVDMA
ncbi:PQ loop repeat-domain-containing protein [Syncephalastrum racemosum]|uniref:PQ loop repeat-domain-containing protein n=1 Tax=Syncephalastrum racemosum TaxID=13706 RepID=A0A1X2HPS1_SYNRA|nr:PQ loop repeat-domain-containing protein [Syncephalastrum racemosum]